MKMQRSVRCLLSTLEVHVLSQGTQLEENMRMEMQLQTYLLPVDSQEKLARSVFAVWETSDRLDRAWSSPH